MTGRTALAVAAMAAVTDRPGVPDIPACVREYMRALGVIGGRSRSAAKVAACRQNAATARAAKVGRKGAAGK